MPIDASIALGVKPPQIEDPTNVLARVMQMQHMQQQQEAGTFDLGLKRRALDDSNRLRDILTGGGDAEALRRGGFLKEANEWDEKQSKIKRETAATEKDNVEAQHKVLGIYRDAVGGITDVNGAADFVRTMHSDPRLKNSPIARVPLDQAIAQIGSDVEAWKKQFALGAAKFMELNAPKTNVVNTGGVTQFVQTPGLGGAPTVAQTFTNTQSPDNAATVAQQAAATAQRAQEAAAARAQAERHFQAGLNAPEYKETEQGIVALPKRLAPGQVPTATPVAGPDGKPLPGKMSEKQKGELMSINQQRSVIDGALAAVKKTPSAFSATRGLATMGGTLTESAAGKFMDTDDERQARSYVFNNVSKVINERAGAAQSAQELARLRAFLPGETDNADQITSKFKAFKTYLNDLERGTRGSGGSVAPSTATANTGGVSGDFGSAIDAELARRGVKK